MELFRLFGSILVDNKEANKSIADTDSKGQSVAKTLGQGVQSAVKWGTAIVGGATAAVGGLLAVTSKTTAYADEIDKLSERTGINREELQRWKYAAEQSGADIGKLETGVKTLSGVMDEAIRGNAKASEAFGQLGISIDDLKTRSQEDIFNQIMNSLGDMEQGAQRNALGNDLLGKSYTEMLPLLNAGADGMDALKNRADELGIVMSEDMVKSNVKLADTMEDVKSSFGGIVREMTGAFLPILQQFSEFIIANMPAIKSIVSGVFEGIGSAVTAVLPFLMQLITDLLPPMISLFSDIAANILPPVITLFTQIVTTILPPLLTLFSGVIQTILPPLIDLFTVIIDEILPPFIDLFNNVISAVLPPLMELFDKIIKTILPPLIELFSEIIKGIMPVLMELFGAFTEFVLPPLIDVITLIVDEILPPLIDIFTELAKLVLPLVMSVFEAMQPVIEPIMKAIAAVIKTVVAIIKGDWEGAWNGIKEFFGSVLDFIMKAVEGFANVFGKIFSGIKDVVLGIWDGIVNGIKGAINWILGGINAFISSLNKIEIPDWVPVVGGKGINIPEIPLLAAGGEIVKGGRAIVGEMGPELLELPQGAKVRPLGGGDIILNINNPKFFSQRDMDQMLDGAVRRIKAKVVTA